MISKYSEATKKIYCKRRSYTVVVRPNGDWVGFFKKAPKFKEAPWDPFKDEVDGWRYLINKCQSGI